MAQSYSQGTCGIQSVYQGQGNAPRPRRCGCNCGQCACSENSNNESATRQTMGLTTYTTNHQNAQNH